MLSKAEPIRVLFDGEAFLLQRRSGITRYLSELVATYRSLPELGIEPVTPYRFIANAHLSEALPKDFHEVPLPARTRARVTDVLNRRAYRQAPAADVVHHSLYRPIALERWRAPRRVCTVHDFTMELLPHCFGDVDEHLRRKRLFFETCDLLICVSETTRADLRRYHPDLDKPTVVVPHGVSPMFFEAPTVAVPRLPRRYLLHVGHRYPHKNVDVLFQAFAQLARHHRDLNLVLCGNGQESEPARLAELGIAGRTTVLGNVSDAQLPAVYAGAEALVFPSLYEGFGLPVLEAMAAGCPVVISRTPALMEVGADIALDVDADDPQALADGIERVLSDTASVRRAVGAGRDRAAEFTWIRSARATAAAYDLATGD